jgi:hypothetical protein
MSNRRLLDIDQLGETLDTTTTDLFRWETLSAYEVVSDGSDYKRYLDGAAEPTWERKQPWLDTLRRWAKEGRPRRRVRIIHDPITDYERYSCDWGYSINSQAGEQIKVIDLATTVLPEQLRIREDFWLIDDEIAVTMFYAEDGQFQKALAVTHSPEVRFFREAAQMAWELGEDFNTWWADHPEHHRRTTQPA